MHANKRLLNTHDTFKTTNSIEYRIEHGNYSSYAPRAMPHNNVEYLRNMQERVFQQPPPPLQPQISEAKNEYCAKKLDEEKLWNPTMRATCEIKALGRDEQRPIYLHEEGCYKHMDPYMTNSRLNHIHFTKAQRDGIASRDVITIYDASEGLRGNREYGSKNGATLEPIFRSQTSQMHDKLKFATKIEDRVIHTALKRVPNFGMQSEYQNRYISHSFSDFFSHLHSTSVDFPDSLAGASAWQNFAPPGMYRTEYCHLNSGWPVRSVIDQKKCERMRHDLDLCRADLSTN